MGNCIQKGITLVLNALVSVFVGKENPQNEQIQDGEVEDANHPPHARRKYYVRLRSAVQTASQFGQESLAKIVVCLHPSAKFKNRMTSYLAYPNYFEEEKTYLKNFVRGLDDQDSFLHRAILDQRLYLLDVQLEDPRIDINIRNQNFESLLLAAVKIENKESSFRIIQKLLRRKDLNVNLSDYNGDTPLHEAAKNAINENPEKIISLLLNHPKIQVNARNYLGETPLHVANTATAVKKLLDKGAEINNQDNSRNIPLHKQVKDLSICQILIAKGSELDCKNVNGFTPLHEAAWYNCEETLDLLLEVGADSNVESDHGRRISPLAISYRARSSEYIKERLWQKSKPIYLLFPASYDATKIPQVLDSWNAAVPDDKVVDFIIEVIGLLKSAKDLKWVACGRLICDYFLTKISDVSKHDSQRIIKKFSAYMMSTMINFMLKTQDYTRPGSLNEIDEIIYTLLDKGDHLSYSDLEIIFIEFGDCHLLHRLLELPLYRNTTKYKGLAFFIQALTNLQISLGQKLEDTTLSNTSIMDFYSIHCLARHCTLPARVRQRFRATYEYLKKYERPGFCSKHIERVFEEIEKTPKVMSLCEMSRNALRPYLCKRYKTNRTYDLYKILERIGVPPVIIDIIMLEVPLYSNIEPPDYVPYSRHTYLL